MHAPPIPRPPRSPLVRRTLAVLLSLLAVAALVFGPHWLGAVRQPAGTVPSARADTGGPRTSSGPVLAEAIAVRTIEVRAHRGDPSPHPLRASGTLRPRRELSLAFAVGGVVATVEADEGDSLARGAVFARLDPIPFEAAVDEAASRVAYLEKSLERSRTLREQKALSDEEFDAQTAELAGARAQLRRARWNLDRSVLRAPFDGVVLERHVEPGQVVAGGSPAGAFVELLVLELDAALPARDLASVDLGAPVTLVSRDDPRLRATGRVDHAPVSSDARSGSVPLRIVVDNTDRRLLPGMVVEAGFSSTDDSTRTSELRVPLTALRLDGEGQAVWRIEDGRARRVAVRLGPVRGDAVVIEEGLSAGDLVVDEAPDRLRDGDAVVVADRREDGR